MGKSEIMADSTGRHGPRHMRTCRGRLTRRLRRGPSVREDWTNQGRALRRLGEPNAGRAYGSHRPAAVPQSALSGGSSQSHDLLRAFRVAYRSDTPVRPEHDARPMLHYVATREDAMADFKAVRERKP